MPEARAAALHLAFAPGVHLEHSAAGLQVRGPEAVLELASPPRALEEALARLRGPGAPEPVLIECVEREDDPSATALLHALLERLSRRGLLHYRVQGPEGAWMTLEPRSPGFALAVRSPSSEQPLRLSRFAHVRREAEALVLESPRVAARGVLEGGRPLTLLAVFARATPPLEAVRGLAPAEVSAALACVELLARAGFLLESGSGGRTEEEREPSLALWEFHDLLFHATSRRFWYGRRRGATWRGVGSFAPLDVVPPALGEPVALPVPDLARHRRDDPPLAEVMEQRRSRRDPGDVPLTHAQLGELLYRCARVREVRPSEHDTVSSRPYPSGGARYPLEVYAVVRECGGLEPGLYHYDALHHRLERRGAWTQPVEALLTEAQVGPRPPQVLLILAARFARTSYKYESIAYSLILKEAGALLQSLCLAATAMGLSACMVGRGNPDMFERAAFTESLTESSVAELVLGGPPAPDPGWQNNPQHE